jgi:alcohol dehydrogenase YqhD (iron-dependent ADH family)
VDIFCHLVEPYITSSEPNLINDALREACMRTVVESLTAVLAKPDDLTHRERLSWASTIACSQFANLGGGGGMMTLHGIEHALSGTYDMAHGDGLASLLIAWMKYTLPAREDKFKALGRNVFGKEDGIKATEDWLKQIGMLHKLKDLGAKESDFNSLAGNVHKTAMWVKMHPLPMDEQAITSIYRACY